MRARGAAIPAVLAAAAAFAAVPSSAFGQAAAGNGSAAGEYGDYVPNTSGTSKPQPNKPTSSHPAVTHHSSPPVRHYVPPARTYVSPARTYVPPAATPTTTAPRTVTAAPSSPARPRHRHHARRHRSHAAAAVSHTSAKPQLTHSKNVGVPAAPAASVDGGSRQLVLLGLAMLTMTVAVFARAGWRRRHGSV
jgi:hypothetical protein